MEISIKNFGTIKSARVKIGGLTVIAGENDSGKSTIGKILFSIVKAFSRIEDELVENKNSRILEICESIYFSLRRSIPLSLNSEIRMHFIPPKFTDNIQVHGEDAIYERKKHLDHLFDNNDINEKIFNEITENLERIKFIINEDEDPKEVIRNAVRRAFYSEFRGEIASKSTTENATVEINDGATRLIKLEWNKSELFNLDLNDDISFDDVTYFESAATIQFHHFIQMARTLFDNTQSRNRDLMVPLHIKDLSKKLHDSMYNLGLNESDNLSEFKDIYEGDFYFDRDSSQFILQRENYKISSGNVASGIKNLGVFDMLVQGNHVNSKTLTIIDEPEVNLHPDWQVKYAKAITILASRGANIIVTTHSPYIVESLSLYSEKSSLDIKFYLTQKNGSGIEFDDVSDNLPKIISKLSKPLHDLHMEVDDDF